ncbi:MAG: c-type cytochrome [Hyphomonadaceae bacterium]|nr:c-type cytochrome [Hyphomonadaceae bacterium]
MIRVAWLALVAVLAAACAPSGLHDFVRGYGRAETSALAAYDLDALARADRGAVLFALGDFGALDTDAMETHAVPWRLAGAALVQAEHAATGAPLSEQTLRTVMRRFGFLYPAAIGNWPRGAAAPELVGPLGLNTGMIRRRVPPVDLMAANLGCASCHAGVTYDATGAPLPDLPWLGAPNTSLDLEAYVQAVYRAFDAAAADPDALFAVIPHVFPDVTAAEISTLRSFVWPRVTRRMAQIAAATPGKPLPFVNGAPGLTNGVAALKMQFALLGPDAHAAERGFTAVPDLGDRGLRTSLLYDGAYAAATAGPDRPFTRADVTDAHLDGLAMITAFFTVPSMGVHPDRVGDALSDAQDVFRFLDAYAPPRFPGRVDAARAAEGRALYADRCAACHGVYDDSLTAPRLVSFPNVSGAVDADPARAQAFTPALAGAVNASAYGDRIRARSTGRYAAPPLTGVWMSAPYLHNGSVPTLRHLLAPATRPERFMLGGHRLDLDAVGVAGEVNGDGVYAYPAGYAPFSAPVLIDTRAPGLSNRGHEDTFEGLRPREREALIAYLKLL